MQHIYSLPGFEALKYRPYFPRALVLDEGENMFDRISGAT